MSERDYIFIEGKLRYWPMCKTPGCTNRMNMAANNGLCWPCQPSGKSFDELMESLGSPVSASSD